MSPEIYKLLHLTGLIFLFTGIGGFLALNKENVRHGKFAVYLHGVGLVLLLVSGFGLVAKLQIGFPWWIIVKVVVWLFIGGALALAKREVFPVRTVIIVSIFVGLVAAYLGLSHSIVA
jgi:uncharacterized membrane protein SirB2